MSYRIKRIIRNLRPELISEVFYEHDLTKFPKVEVKIPLSTKILDKNNISRINEVKKLSLDCMKRRLENGDMCFVTENLGRLMSYHWVQFRGNHYVQQTGKLVRLLPREAVIYHVRVKEDYRGNRINGFVNLEILEYCKNSGYNRVWIYTNKKNVSNRKGLENLGFKAYKVTLSLKFYNRFYLLGSKKINT